MIEIHIGATVESEGREVGRVERVVLDRDSNEATHLVIKYGGPLNARQVLMPLSWVARSEHNRVRINHSSAECENLPNYELQHYARLDELGQGELEHHRAKIKPADWINYVVPLVANAFGDPYHTPGVVVTDRLITPAENAVRRGLTVESRDGYKLGALQEVLLSEPDWRLSGVIIERGFIITHPMRIPADWVFSITSDRIILNRTREQVKSWEREQRESSQ
jgi:uncharacterized protein YrrD